MGTTALRETSQGDGATSTGRPARNAGSGSAAAEKEKMAAKTPSSSDSLMTDAGAPSGRAYAGAPTGRAPGLRVTLRFDDSAWVTLEAAAGRDHETLDDFVSRAVLYYQAELPASRIAMSAPRFKPPGHGSPRDLALGIPSEAGERMKAEAARQDAPLEQLYEHATLLYLADIDAGRVADRVLEGAEEVEPDDA